MNDYEKNIEEKVKKFVTEQYKIAVRYAETASDVYRNRAIAYGAVQFSINNLFPYYYNDDLGDWWDKQLDKFNQLALDKQK